MRYFNRRVYVTLFGAGGTHKVAPDMNIDFSVSMDIGGKANTAEVTIINLSKSTRQKIGKEFDQFQIEAGYEPPASLGGGSNVSLLFKGNIRDVVHTRRDADWSTRISCGDGDKAFRSATISKTIPAGSSVKDAVEAIQTELEKKGIERGEWKFPDDIEEKKFKRPYSMCGSCVREMNTLGRGKGFYWSVQNGVTEIVPGNGYIGDTITIGADGGMINAPQITDNGVRFEHLLEPAIKPGRRVKIVSKVLEANSEDDTFRVASCVFSGNSRDGKFQVEATCESIADGKVKEGEKPK